MRFPFARTFKKMVEVRQAQQVLRENRWCFSKSRVQLFLNEYGEYKRNYLPVDVAGLTVLDVGAGEGETALFYLSHFAKKVICVESDPKCYHNLLFNSFCHSDRMVAICEPFNLEMLVGCRYDLMKMDIEGYEEILLDVDLPKPAVIEVHGLQLRDKFKAKGYRIGERYAEKYRATSTSYAYWRV